MLILSAESSLRFGVDPSLYDELRHQAAFGFGERSYQFVRGGDLEQSFNSVASAVSYPIERTAPQITIEIENHPSQLRWFEYFVGEADRRASIVEPSNWRRSARLAMARLDSFLDTPDDILASIDQVTEHSMNRSGPWLFEFLEMHALGWLFRTFPFDGADYIGVRFDPAQAHLTMRRIMSGAERLVPAHQALQLERLKIEVADGQMAAWRARLAERAACIAARKRLQPSMALDVVSKG
jgi:hypothetical protein